MKIKNITFNQKAIDKLLEGARILVQAVGGTLGPSGKNVIIEDEFGGIKTTKDGVSVAKEIKLKDPIENIGAQLVREAAQQTADQAGDGTTTSTILAYYMIREGLKLTGKGINPIDMKTGMEKAISDVVDMLKDMKKDVRKDEEIEQIATISANNDEQIGKLIAEAIKEVGLEGVVTVEESKSSENSLELVEGMQINKGYLSPYFINNEKTMQFEANDVYILLYGKKINEMNKGFIGLLERIIAKNKPLLIIAEDVSGPALAGLIVNKTRGNILVCAVKSPEFGERRKDILQDLAILTGGKVISDDKGIKLENIELDMLGKARTVTANNKQTMIVDGEGTKEDIKNRIKEIKILIEKADSPYEKERLQERLAKLSGGVAILNIGGNTEIEMKEKKDRVDDALHATRAAIEEGIIPGGGITLKNISTTELKYEKLNDDQQLGYKIVINSLQEPFNIIMENIGENGDAIWQKVSNANKNSSDVIGFDARKKEIVDMFERGIIDPTKVTRIALEKAVSVAITFLVTNCVISIDPEEKDEKNTNQLMGY